MPLLPALPPEATFDAANAFALIGWLALAASPPGRRWTATIWQLTGWVMPLLLALVYGVLLLGHPGAGGFGSLAAVRQLFEQPGLLAAGWLHYLAFDLFVGTWIARQAAERGIRHRWVLPCLLLTFLLGPTGLLAFAALTLLHERISR